MNDNYCFSVGCIVRRKKQVLLVRHTYGGAKGKLVFEMDYINGIPTSDMNENSEVLFCEISDALTRNDCTEMTKVSLRKILDDSADYLYSDIEYKAHKGSDYTLYI